MAIGNMQASFFFENYVKWANDIPCGYGLKNVEQFRNNDITTQASFLFHNCVKRAYCSKNVEPFRNNDIATQVLSRLPVKSLMAFKCTSKKWNAFVSDSVFLRLHSQSSKAISGLFAHALLDYCTWDNESVYYIDVDKEPSAVQDTFLDFLPEKVVLLNSSNGILCVRSCITRSWVRRERLRFTRKDFSKTDLVIYICNPATKEWVTVEPDRLHESQSFGLAFYPSGSSSTFGPSFKLVSLQRSVSDPGIYTFTVYSSETQEWTTSELVCKFSSKVHWDKICFVNGRFHWLTWNHHVMTFDVEREAAQVMKLPGLTPYESGGWGIGVCFGNSEGNFHHVCSYKFDVKIWMLTDYSEPNWVLKHKLPLIEFCRDYGSKVDTYSVLRDMEGRHPESSANDGFLTLAFEDDVLFTIMGECIVAYNFRTRSNVSGKTKRRRKHRSTSEKKARQQPSLKELEGNIYTFPDFDIPGILDFLLENGIIELLESYRPEESGGVNEASAHLDLEEEERYFELLKEFKDVFAWTYKKMSGLDSEAAVHYVDVKSGVHHVKEAQCTFHPKKDTSFEWDQACQNAFDNIKKYPLSLPILGALTPEKPLILYIAAQEESLGIPSLVVSGDSKLVINQLLKKYKVKKEDLVPYFLYATNLINRFDSVELEHVRRQENRIADVLANLATTLALSGEEKATQAMDEAHLGVCSAHQSGLKLQFQIKRMGYCWPTMVKDCMDYAKRYNGRPFDNTLTDQLCTKFGFKQHNSSMYNAPANGLVEAFNKTLCNLFKKVVEKSKKDWYEKIGEALWMYRTTYRTPTRATPYSLVYDFEALGEKRLEAQQHLEYYQAKLSRAFNKRVRPWSFAVGDLVLAFWRPIITTHHMGSKFTLK
ncbi:hypothetical protein RJ639_022088 [Escallonia herrerae]|uniref:F-box domain-containing protein n=1 Tax=Escallonia herrerae TaxID=1293975 RepID=A0AA88V4S8_9ASTE|nr:hypothetical protein RJ639_022088 [Escallonia herrerae]